MQTEMGSMRISNLQCLSWCLHWALCFLISRRTMHEHECIAMMKWNALVYRYVNIHTGMTKTRVPRIVTYMATPYSIRQIISGNFKSTLMVSFHSNCQSVHFFCFREIQYFGETPFHKNIVNIQFLLRAACGTGESGPKRKCQQFNPRSAPPKHPQVQEHHPRNTITSPQKYKNITPEIQ